MTRPCYACGKLHIVHRAKLRSHSGEWADVHRSYDPVRLWSWLAGAAFCVAVWSVTLYLTARAMGLDWAT